MLKVIALEGVWKALLNKHKDRCFVETVICWSQQGFCRKACVLEWAINERLASLWS